jgi:hypothetical protein
LAGLTRILIEPLSSIAAQDFVSAKHFALKRSKEFVMKLHKYHSIRKPSVGISVLLAAVWQSLDYVSPIMGLTGGHRRFSGSSFPFKLKEFTGVTYAQYFSDIQTREWDVTQFAA